MSEPKRLLSGATLSDEGGATDFERELLGAWNAEQPSGEARAKVLAMVGLSASAAAGTVAAVAKAGAGAAGGSIAPKAGTVGAAALMKWLALSAVGAVIAGATLAQFHNARHEPSAVHPALSFSPPSPTTNAPAPAAPPASAPLATATSVQELSPRGVPLQRRPPSGAGTDRSARTTDDALGEQVSALDRARRALADGDASGALRQLGDYEARFPRGALIEEAEVLRVESLLAENDRASAARVGARFLANHASSPHAARIRSLLGIAPSP